MAIPVSAQTERPHYQPTRYEEGWSALRDPALRDDLWDPVKDVSLGCADWFLTLAGEARERYELLDHPAFGYVAPDSNGCLLQRFLFSSAWHLGRRTRIFAELQSGLTHGRNGPPI